MLLPVPPSPLSSLPSCCSSFAALPRPTPPPRRLYHRYLTLTLRYPRCWQSSSFVLSCPILHPSPHACVRTCGVLLFLSELWYTGLGLRQYLYLSTYPSFYPHLWTGRLLPFSLHVILAALPAVTVGSLLLLPSVTVPSSRIYRYVIRSSYPRLPLYPPFGSFFYYWIRVQQKHSVNGGAFLALKTLRVVNPGLSGCRTGAQLDVARVHVTARGYVRQ